MQDHVRDPEEIYALSFEKISREVDLSLFSEGMADVVARMIHACGMTDIVDDFEYSPHALGKGIDALRGGEPIICDVEMVRQGIISRHLDSENEILCAIGLAEVAEAAMHRRSTRSAAAIDHLAGRLEHSVVVIGNAPTALFRLLETVAEGAGKPALVIGMPVGFVGAVESKQALAANRLGLDYMTLHGRRGGSAIAAAALNAIAVLAAPS